jgi:hypothetical protein
MYTCTYLHTYVYTHMYIMLSTGHKKYTHLCALAHTHMCTYLHASVYRHIHHAEYKQEVIHTFMRMRTHTNTYSQTQIHGSLVSASTHLSVSTYTRASTEVLIFISIKHTYMQTHTSTHSPTHSHDSYVRASHIHPYPHSPARLQTYSDIQSDHKNTGMIQLYPNSWHMHHNCADWSNIRLRCRRVRRCRRSRVCCTHM